MTQETIYTCDRCEQKQPPRIETSLPPLYRLELRCIAIDARETYIPTTHQVEWCYDCVTKMGVKRPLIYAQGDGPPAVSMEQLVRDIVRSEMEG